MKRSTHKKILRWGYFLLSNYIISTGIYIVSPAGEVKSFFYGVLGMSGILTIFVLWGMGYMTKFFTNEYFLSIGTGWRGEWKRTYLRTGVFGYLLIDEEIEIFDEYIRTHIEK